MNISTTYIAGIVSIITLALPVFGFELADKATLTRLITDTLGVCGAVYVFIGRYNAGGINIFGIRKAK